MRLPAGVSGSEADTLTKTGESSLKLCFKSSISPPPKFICRLLAAPSVNYFGRLIFLYHFLVWFR